MKRFVLFLCLLLIICSCQTAPQAKREPSADQIQAFFTAIEAMPGGIQNWQQVQPLAAQHNIPDQMNLESWSQLVHAAASTGMTSWVVLQLHPLLKQRPYFDEVVHVLGYDSDLFTRLCVFENMWELYPEDPRTPKFGLLLLLDVWSSKWPDGMDLHGNSPRETLAITITQQWEGPRLALNNQGNEGTLGLAGVTPERCAQLLSQSDRWVFDQNDRKWKVKPLP